MQTQCYGLFWRSQRGTPKAAKLINSTVYWDRADATEALEQMEAAHAIEIRSMVVVVECAVKAEDKTMTENAKSTALGNAAVIGPQRMPASEARIKAQQRQMDKQGPEPMCGDHRAYCDACGCELVRKLSMAFCSQCFRIAK